MNAHEANSLNLTIRNSVLGELASERGPAGSRGKCSRVTQAQASKEEEKVRSV